jgi:RHS repeat-associated protein
MVNGKATGFNGIVTTNAYNSRLQPILLSAGVSGQNPVFSDCYDFHLGVAITQPSPCSFSKSTAGDNGNVYQILNNRDNTRTQNFTYDRLNRIYSAESSGSLWGETFTIDAWGNLTAKTGIAGKNHAEGFNEPIATNNQFASSSGFTYDTAGNMHYDGSITYNYDAENRLVSVSSGGYNYYYDGDGNRVAKSNGSTGTLYWRGPTDDPISESSLSGTSQEEYIFFDNQRIARRDVSSGAVHYYFGDHLGSTAVVENAIASSCEQDIDYYPYGAVINDNCGTVTQHYRFTGKERDSESGLDNFGARYNASTMGRFMTPDPLGGHLEDPQTLNKYAYVRNNPTTLTDPTGLDWYLGCASSDHSGCTQLSDKDKTWVQADKNGNATIVTSDSIRSGDNSATVDKNGVEVTTGGKTYQGVYFDNPASHTTDANGNDVNHNPITLQGDASKGFGGFTFNFNGNCGGTCLSSGSFQFAGTPQQARAALKAAGAWDYGVFDQIDGSNLPFFGHHPDSTQFRFGSGPSPHFSLPDLFLSTPMGAIYGNPKSTVPASGDFHVDSSTGFFSHGLCSNFGVGCSK